MRHSGRASYINPTRQNMLVPHLSCSWIDSRDSIQYAKCLMLVIRIGMTSHPRSRSLCSLWTTSRSCFEQNLKYIRYGLVNRKGDRYDTSRLGLCQTATSRVSVMPKWQDLDIVPRRRMYNETRKQPTRLQYSPCSNQSAHLGFMRVMQHISIINFVFT